VRGGIGAYEKMFNGPFVTSVRSQGSETQHLGPERKAAVCNNAHMSLGITSSSLALSRGRAMPLAHSKLQQRIGSGRGLEIPHPPYARGIIESSLASALSAPHTLTRAPRAREHQAAPNDPGGAIAGVLDCGDCAACGWFQTLVGD